MGRSSLQEGCSHLEVRSLFIEPESPWENGFVEFFNGRMRDEPLDREIFYTVKEARHLIEMWWWQYPVPGRCNHVRPHSSLGYETPAPAAWIAIGQPLKPVSLT